MMLKHACVLILLVGAMTRPAIAQLSGSDAGAIANYEDQLARQIRGAAESVLPSIVTIEVVGVLQAAAEVQQDAPTSGVLLSRDGHVLTSSQVLRGNAASILVVLTDGQRAAATIVARDEHRDLVLLQFDPSSIQNNQRLQPINLFDVSSDALGDAGVQAGDLTVGQTMIAVARYGRDGVPLVSSGILSAVDRLDGIALQTDARVSPAFYGGPLIDLRGRFVGVLIPATGGNEDPTAWYDSGIAFAIPAETISKNWTRLRDGETIRRGLVGFVVGDRDPYAPGTSISAVRKRSPAEESGLAVGDELIAVGGRPVARRQDVKLALGRFDAGDVVDIEFQRDEQTRSIEVTLAESIPPLQPTRLGIVVTSTESEIQVTGTIANLPAESKLLVGDVIRRIDDSDVSGVDALRKQLWTHDPAEPLLLTIDRAGVSESIEIVPQLIDGPIDPLTAQSQRLELSTSKIADDELAQISWQVESFRLTDVENPAALLHPKVQDDNEVDDPRSLGLLTIVLPPGKRDPSEFLQDWIDVARRAGVVVLAIASSSEGRWKPAEIDSIGKLAAAATRSSNVDSAAVVVAGPSVVSGESEPGPADSVAIAASLASNGIFSGLAIHPSSRPPAVRLSSESDLMMLRVLVRLGNNDMLPSWSGTLRQLGFPIQTQSSVTKRELLDWTMSLLVL